MPYKQVMGPIWPMDCSLPIPLVNYSFICVLVAVYFFVCASQSLESILHEVRGGALSNC